MLSTDKTKLSSVDFENPGIADTPRKTITYDACCNIDFIGRVLDYNKASGSMSVTTQMNKLYPPVSLPGVRFETLFLKILFIFNEENINLPEFENLYDLFKSNIIDFWNYYGRNGSSLFGKIFKLPVRAMIENPKLNAAGQATKQCNEIIGAPSPTCMYCGVQNVKSIVDTLTCEHLLEALPLFMTLGLAPNKSNYPPEAFKLVKDFLTTCGCYTWACYHCNMVKAQVQQYYAGIFVTIIQNPSTSIFEFGINENAVDDYSRLFFTKLFFAPKKGGFSIQTWYTGLGSHIINIIINRLSDSDCIDNTTGSTIVYPLVLIYQSRDLLHYIGSQPDYHDSGDVTLNGEEELKSFLQTYYFDMSSASDNKTPYIRNLVERFSLYNLVKGNVVGLLAKLIVNLNIVIKDPFFTDIYNLLAYGILKVFSRASILFNRTCIQTLVGKVSGGTKQYNLKGGLNNQEVQEIFTNDANIGCIDPYINEILFNYNGNNEIQTQLDEIQKQELVDIYITASEIKEMIQSQSSNINEFIQNAYSSISILSIDVPDKDIILSIVIAQKIKEIILPHSSNINELIQNAHSLISSQEIMVPAYIINSDSQAVIPESVSGKQMVFSIVIAQYITETILPHSSNINELIQNAHSLISSLSSINVSDKEMIFSITQAYAQIQVYENVKIEELDSRSQFAYNYKNVLGIQSRVNEVIGQLNDARNMVEQLLKPHMSEELKKQAYAMYRQSLEHAQTSLGYAITALTQIKQSPIQDTITQIHDTLIQIHHTLTQLQIQEKEMNPRQIETMLRQILQALSEIKLDQRYEDIIKAYEEAQQARGYGGKKRKNKRKTKRRKQKKHLKRKTRK
jgi:hypothetical protein